MLKDLKYVTATCVCLNNFENVRFLPSENVEYGALFTFTSLSIKCLSIKMNEREKKVSCAAKIVSINFNTLAKVLVFLWSERMCFYPQALRNILYEKHRLLLHR